MMGAPVLTQILYIVSYLAVKLIVKKCRMESVMHPTCLFIAGAFILFTRLEI